MRAESHLLVVNRKVRHTSAQPEEVLSLVAIALVLLLGVGHGLLRQAVLQLEGRHGQTVYEQREVKGQAGVGPAVVQLAGYGEPVQGVELPSPLVPGCRGTIEQRNVVLAMPDSVAEYIDHASIGDLPLQPRQKALSRDVVSIQR